MQTPEITEVRAELDRLMRGGWNPQDVVGALVQAMETIATRRGVEYEQVRDSVFSAIDRDPRVLSERQSK